MVIGGVTVASRDDDVIAYRPVAIDGCCLKRLIPPAAGGVRREGAPLDFHQRVHSITKGELPT
jgi:hypothetical protein